MIISQVTKKKDNISNEALGGSISGSLRVVWERKKRSQSGTGEQYLIDKIPLLNMTRSLGDLWSITSNNKYLVSPVPDIQVHSHRTCS